MLLGISLTGKFLKIVVGYFLYGSARGTAMRLDRGARGILSPGEALSQQEFKRVYQFLQDQTKNRQRFR